MSDRNETMFAQRWVHANALLMDAIAEPSSESFDTAHKAAIRTIGAAYTGPSKGGVEWDMGQALSTLIRDVAHEHGYKV